MLFNSLTFFCFLPIVFVLYWSVRTNLRVQNIFLLFASYVFYGWWDVRFLTLIIASTAVDFILGKIMDTASSSVKRKLLISASMIFNLGLLGVFKYYNFFIENFVVLSDRMGLSTNLVLLKIILPVGISFYTFQTMSYTIDIYRKKLKHTSDFIAFAAFVGYFPQLVAGPIERAAHLLPQLGKIRVFNSTNAANGLRQALWGFFKKVVIADAVAPLVDLAFSNPESYSSLALILGAVLFSIQIYCDFSGYSDIAIGLAALLGFKLPINFNGPYKSQSLTEFWRRWHISLSTWLRDYLYISIGGNRKGKIRTYINLIVTMLLGGLWHGAATKFVVWGALHGVGLAIHRLWAKRFNMATTKAGQAIAVIITFHFVAFSWMYFRASDMNTVDAMVSIIFTDFDFGGAPSRIVAYWKVFALMLTGYVVHMLPSSLKNRLQWWFIEAPMYVKILIFVLVVFGIYQATSAGIQPFIYFQF